MKSYGQYYGISMDNKIKLPNYIGGTYCRETVSDNFKQKVYRVNNSKKNKKNTNVLSNGNIFIGIIDNDILTIKSKRKKLLDKTFYYFMRAAIQSINKKPVGKIYGGIEKIKSIYNRNLINSNGFYIRIPAQLCLHPVKMYYLWGLQRMLVGIIWKKLIKN